ncbi:MAG: ABC transporter ATP-binding protein [Spirochaetaceae bacterium]|nr:MAG: ABC transporter ATP-binding protein [Spirochaetaceae bacterium]
MLELRGICKRFPGKPDAVLSEVSCTVRKGETVALVGENGAGKSTLVRILSQILRQDAGTVFLDSVGVHRDPGYMKRRTATLFSGESSLYDRLTARENIVYHARLNGIRKAHYEHHLTALIEELSLSRYIDDRVSTFSRGMKQRTAIARTLITDPEFIILDEPSSGLDIIAIESVKAIISRLRMNGKTVLFSSHSLDEILCAQRVIILHAGRIVCDSPVERFLPGGGEDIPSYLRD